MGFKSGKRLLASGGPRGVGSIVLKQRPAPNTWTVNGTWGQIWNSTGATFRYCRRTHFALT